jgi:hypothetical protein
MGLLKKRQNEKMGTAHKALVTLLDRQGAFYLLFQHM